MLAVYLAGPVVLALVACLAPRRIGLTVAALAFLAGVALVLAVGEPLPDESGSPASVLDGFHALARLYARGVTLLFTVILGVRWLGPPNVSHASS